MKKDIWFNITMLIASIFILMGLLNKESGDTFELIQRMGYLLLFSAMSWDSYISYMQEKSKKNLIQLCIYVFILAFFFFWFLIETF